ncbi:DUF1456 family protein [Marinomonas rhizomae]|uniref:Uncharacterized protein YehS (DUF1456 family) n=1 Tax=Marinomonas rhizomae TaxID=491948 RepID=A0A366JDK2_9GAMM|nr:DUF1456 family protein [Marinomonas rhizomae]RBP85042.1 uncharacterized protein YehS (DUF1456 family) [Marinomonas rhizomae]RNF76156.1 DUF1456 family protein [Marinomonas rhizomae]
MNNNDILRRLRYTFDLKELDIVDIFASADGIASQEQVTSWLKKEDDAGYVEMIDVEMATFLNGLINTKRGKREGPQPVPEKRLTNNAVFMKLRIALNLQAEEILDIMSLAEFNLSKHELSSFFRKPGNRHYCECKDQILRNFLMGLQKQFRV